MSAKVQRLRLTYARGLPQRYVSHLDMMRFWERALRRAQLPIAYSEGFSPHAQITLGPPLGVGMTGRAEMLDLFLHTPVPATEARERIQAQLPAGVEISSAEEVELGAPSLQASLRAIDYRFYLNETADLDAIVERIAFFLASSSVPWEHQRDKETRRYDLRPLVLTLNLEREDEAGAEAVVAARLRAEESGTARPDQVALALGIADEVRLIERAALIVATPAPSR
jgi:radical SAM-linked protein